MKPLFSWILGLTTATALVVACDRATAPQPVDTNPTDTSSNGTTVTRGAVTITPVDSTRFDSIVVTMATTPATDTIVYTTSGLTPTGTDNIYTGPIVIKGATTFKAAVYKSKKIGAVTTKNYFIVGKVSKPTFSTRRVDTNEVAPVNVVIKAASELEDTIRYTTNGGDVTVKSPSISTGGSYPVTRTTTLIARSFNGRNQPSEPETTLVVMRVAKPVAVVPEGMRDSTINIAFSSATSETKTYYTLDGTTPVCGKSAELVDSLAADSSISITAIACKDGWTQSKQTTAKYVFKVGTPKPSIPAGTYRDSVALKLSTRTPRSIFFYTTDSSTPAWDPSTLRPTGKTYLYDSVKGIAVDKSFWLRAVGVRDGWLPSDTTLLRYNVSGDTLRLEDWEDLTPGAPSEKERAFFWSCKYCTANGKQSEAVENVDTTTADWKKEIGFRTFGLKFNFGVQSNYSDVSEPGYAGFSIPAPSEGLANGYRLVFWTKFVNTSGVVVPNVPLIVEMVLKANNQKNGGYSDGYHRLVTTSGSAWEKKVFDLGEFRGAGNAYRGASVQRDSTDDNPRQVSRFYFPDSARMVSLGLSKYQGQVTHNNFKPVWVWDVDHEAGFSKGDIVGFRFSIMQPMKTVQDAAAVTRSPSIPPSAGPPSLTNSEMKNLADDFGGTLYIDKIMWVNRPL